MALNTQNTDAISFKKLNGKGHTQQNFAVSEEGISSNIQISYTTVFGDEINGLPETNGLTTAYQNDGIVERVKFEVDIIPDTEILVGRSQGYRLKLPSDYNVNGYLFPNFSGGTYLHETLGKLQIVPSLYGTLKSDGSTEYDAKVYQTDGSTQITKFDSINWILDTYNGILFIQDPPEGYNASANRPGFVEAFLYVGRFVNDALGSSNSYWKSSGTTTVSSGTTISGATVRFSHDLEYITDLSSEFTKHSIVDVNYVTGLTSQITSGFTQAGNGITVNGSVVSLGGGLSGDTVFTDTRATKKGLEYGDNYSIDFVKHSLVDVNFVTGITSQIAASSGLTLATNGLTKVDGYIRLGGTPLSESTSIDGNSQIFSLTDASKIVLTARNSSTSESVGITINSTGFTITDTRTGETGIKYGGDYSSGFTKYSLVDVNYVTGVTGTFTADNGLTKNGINVSLGGVLDIESTVIEGTGNNSGAGYRELYLGSSSGPLGYLEINTDSGTSFNDLLGGGFHVETYQNGTIDLKAFGGSGVVLESKLNGDNTSNKAELNVHYNGLYARNTSNVRSGVTTSLYISRELFAGSGGPQTGFGVKLNFDLTNSLLNVPNAEAGIAYIWNDASEGSEDGRYDITVHANSLEKKIVEIDKNSIKYPSNFSSGFTKHSLVDVNYVTGITSTLGGGSITGATNGLTAVGGTIIFGGTLTGDTTVNNNDNILTFVGETSFDIQNVAATSRFDFLTTSLGATTDISLLSFRSNSGRTVTDGYSDVWLGLNNGNTSSNAGGNIGIGSNNLQSITPTGTFFGSPWYQSFQGDRNIAIGYNNGKSLTGGAGNAASGNILVGTRVMEITTQSSYNIFMGFHTARNFNIPLSSTNGQSNIGIGNYVMQEITGGTASDNVFFGASIASATKTINSSNVGIGNFSYQNVGIVGNSNIAVGTQVYRYSGTLGDHNTAVGSHAFRETVTGMGQNTAVGVEAGVFAGGFSNTYLGAFSGFGVRGQYNTSIGALSGWVTGNDVTTDVIGPAYTGSRSVFVGFQTGYDTTSSAVSDVVVIGNNFRPVLEAGHTYIGGLQEIEFVTDTSGTPKNVLTLHSGGTATFSGIVNYSSDKSSGFTKHSLVDVNYVTGITSTVTTINGVNITGSSYTATTSTDFVGVSGNTAVTVYLPIAPTNYEKIIIADIKGNASSAIITINGNGKLINGSSTALINTNYGAITLIYHGVNWSVVAFA